MKIAIIGGGNMGTTYARAFVRSNIATKDNLLIIEKHEEKRIELEKEGVAILKDGVDKDISSFDIIILAVKPQDFKVLAIELKPLLKKRQIIISIMAGIKIKTISTCLDHEKVARAMPNTPAQLGFGITAFTVNKESSFENISIIDTLLETTGKSIFMKNEGMLDAVTAISGSGPAYFFYFVKHMIEAGKQMGMDEAVATMLVRQTMLGSFQIINNNKASLDQLISSVASKGGTTEAALNKFEECSVGQNIIDALKAAEKRANELSKG
ncbi:MAG: pyrroline-5-carboxylate reductase [Cytophagaceae bacterium]